MLPIAVPPHVNIALRDRRFAWAKRAFQTSKTAIQLRYSPNAGLDESACTLITGR